MGRFSAGLVATAMLVLPGLALAGGLYLHEIPTSVAKPSAAAAGPLRVRAFVADPAALAALLPGVIEILGPSFVEITLETYPEFDAGSPEHYRDASFLIDFEEPAVAAIGDEFHNRYGDSPSLLALREFADAAIPEKVLGRGWDSASRVARSGVGDCTEHAVLLAALARRVGRPARVVAGILLVRIAGEPQAFGHAWAEIHNGDRWVPVDATPVGETEDVLSRIPLVLLRDEGPGYAIGLARQLQRGWVREVEVIAGAD